MPNQPPHDQAYWVGMIVGALVAGAICGLLPLVTGIIKRGPIHITLGVVGFLASIGSGFILGCILALPVALVFFAIIMVIPRPQRPRSFDNDDDAYRQRFRDREDDRPRRRSRPPDDDADEPGITDRTRD